MQRLQRVDRIVGQGPASRMLRKQDSRAAVDGIKDVLDHLQLRLIGEINTAVGESLVSQRHKQEPAV